MDPAEMPGYFCPLLLQHNETQTTGSKDMSGRFLGLSIGTLIMNPTRVIVELDINSLRRSDTIS